MTCAKRSSFVNGRLRFHFGSRQIASRSVLVAQVFLPHVMQKKYNVLLWTISFHETFCLCKRGQDHILIRFIVVQGLTNFQKGRSHHTRWRRRLFTLLSMKSPYICPKSLVWLVSIFSPIIEFFLAYRVPVLPDFWSVGFDILYFRKKAKDPLFTKWWWVLNRLKLEMS